jgi:hypothetical protein
MFFRVANFHTHGVSILDPVMSSLFNKAFFILMSPITEAWPPREKRRRLRETNVSKNRVGRAYG